MLEGVFDMWALYVPGATREGCSFKREGKEGRGVRGGVRGCWRVCWRCGHCTPLAPPEKGVPLKVKMRVRTGGRGGVRVC